MRITTFPLIVALFFAGGLRTTQACVCSGPAVSDRDDAAAAFRDASVVFEGEVSASPKRIVGPTGSGWGLGVIQFRVLRTYKGNLGDSTELFDSMVGTDCGSDDLRPGQKLFVYGFEGEDHKIYLHACSRTTFLVDAGADIRFARNEPPTQEDLAPPGEKWRLYRDATLAERGASLVGTIVRDDGGDVSNAFVTLWLVDENGLRNRAGAVAAVLKVNVDGSFDIRFLAPGRYNVTAADPQVTPTTRYVGEYGNIALAERQVLSSVVVHLHAEPLGSIRVRVVAPLELHDKVIVELRDKTADDTRLAPFAHSQTARIDDKSVASFNSVPYGLYDVYVVLSGEDSNKPSWTHEKVQVELNGNQAEAVVKLQKVRVSDHQP